jgi:penicillin-binding protein 1C
MKFFNWKFRKRPRASLVCSLLIAAVLAGGLCWKTSRDLIPLPQKLPPSPSDYDKPGILDRNGAPLSITYQNYWNVQDRASLHEIPMLLQQAFVESEDQRFHQRIGVDWSARFHAMVQNILALKIVRGASTISEQVIRMLHPRPRTYWSRWLEGIEAGRLDRRFSKGEILEFYLNQVPYAHQRRGVVQAARMYFDRDLDTLNTREMLALAVLVRAPAALDLRRRPLAIRKSVRDLAEKLYAGHLITGAQYQNALTGEWSLGEFHLPVEAGHFVQYLYHTLSAEKGEDGRPGQTGPGVGHAAAERFSPASLTPVSPNESGTITSTLDPSLQGKIQRILDRRLDDLSAGNELDGAVLVVDHKTDEILAWVNGGGLSEDSPGAWIDAVTLPRQPGSTLKPFLYGMALEIGWTPATLIDDSPLAESVGSGLHSFHNYSRTCYGPLRLRDALGNSLNIPAVRTIQFVGVERFLARLHELGFQSLTQPAAYYGSGLALGDGEVSLYELVRAYAVLARRGELKPLHAILKPRPSDDGLSTSVGEEGQGHAARHVGAGFKPARTDHPGDDCDDWKPGEIRGPEIGRHIFTPEITSQISDILSDPQARRLEFGDGNILRLPVQTAVKTGTSSDHRDAWAVGFSSRYTVGVWMGNLDRRPTNGITGTTGPGLVLRAVFAELNKYEEPRPLYISPNLITATICRISGLLAGPDCPTMQEKFRPGTAPLQHCPLRHEELSSSRGAAALLQTDSIDHLRLLQPTPGLELALDPRIPDELEGFSFLLSKHLKIEKVEWKVDGKVIGVTGKNGYRFLWRPSRGSHVAEARVWFTQGSAPADTPPVSFTVR